MPEGWPTNCGNPRQTDCPPGHAKGDLGWMPQYAYPAVRDAKAAVRWVRQNAARFDVDPDYITAFGGSAGATSVMALALLLGKKGGDLVSAGLDCMARQTACHGRGRQRPTDLPSRRVIDL